AFYFCSFIVIFFVLFSWQKSTKNPGLYKFGLKISSLPARSPRSP
ncbi:MAG: hypothetical protein ACI956_001956, partial [Nonlabens sp.]